MFNSSTIENKTSQIITGHFRNLNWRYLPIPYMIYNLIYDIWYIIYHISYIIYHISYYIYIYILIYSLKSQQRLVDDLGRPVQSFAGEPSAAGWTSLGTGLLSCRQDGFQLPLRLTWQRIAIEHDPCWIVDDSQIYRWIKMLAVQNTLLVHQTARHWKISAHWLKNSDFASFSTQLTGSEYVWILGTNVSLNSSKFLGSPVGGMIAMEKGSTILGDSTNAPLRRPRARSVHPSRACFVRKVSTRNHRRLKKWDDLWQAEH